MNLDKVTRVEVIDLKWGRQYVQWDIVHIEAVLQDKDRTLKLFVRREGA